MGMCWNFGVFCCAFSKKETRNGSLFDVVNGCTVYKAQDKNGLT